MQKPEAVSMPVGEVLPRTFAREEFDAAESPIDTRYFGIASARVVLKKPCPPEAWRQLMDFMRQFEFITIINKGDDASNNLWLGEETNAFLADMNVQFSKKVSPSPMPSEDATVIGDRLAEDAGVLRLAESSFAISRFLNDPHLPRGEARKIYGDIVKNAFGKAGRYFVTLAPPETAAGFVLFSINEPGSSCRIELVAVDRNRKGRGIGKTLLRSLESYVAQRKVQTIQVGTQLNNLGALSFYHSYGFSIVECNSIFHYWPSRHGTDPA